MEFDVNKLNRFFSREEFIWFDRRELRNAAELTPEETKYIRSWTFSPLGFGYIFYIAMRVLPDIVSVYVLTYIYFEIAERFIDPIMVVERVGLPVYMGYLIFTLALTVFSLYSFYFTFRHGRRLSWNRGHYVSINLLKWKKVDWKSVQELRESEDRFLKYGTFPSLIFILILAAILISI